jgi:hypothetical protein
VVDETNHLGNVVDNVADNSLVILKCLNYAVKTRHAVAILVSTAIGSRVQGMILISEDTITELATEEQFVLRKVLVGISSMLSL